MFLSDLNVLFLLPGVNHRHTSLPCRPPAAATWALFLHPAARRGGTNQEQTGFGGLFHPTLKCNHAVPNASWSLESRVTELRQPTTTFEQTSSSSRAHVVQKHHTHPP